MGLLPAVDNGSFVRRTIVAVRGTRALIASWNYNLIAVSPLLSYYASGPESSGASKPTAPLHLYGADKYNFSSVLFLE
jgi:hypothetical protein